MGSIAASLPPTGAPSDWTRQLQGASVEARLGIESLPDAVEAVFTRVASQSGYGARATPSSRLANGGVQIRTAEDWQAFMDEVAAAGLLPMDELLEMSKGVALPANWKSFARAIETKYAPPTADKVDALLDDAVNRSKHLTRLLESWEVDDFSPKQTGNAMAMINELRERYHGGVDQLQLWSDGFHAEQGPERVQSLFWDLIDPDAEGNAAWTPHKFQREMEAEIDKRCDAIEVRAAMLRQPEHPLTLKPNGDPRPDVSIATAADMPRLKLRVLRLPHECVWEETSKMCNFVDALRQLALSRHGPAFLGHLPAMPENARTGFPRHARWHIELVDGAPLREGVLHGGRLHETSLLFRHWRREVIEGLCDLSNMTTFLIPHAVGLSHALAADEGCRLVFDDLCWGVEFPEAKWWQVPRSQIRDAVVQKALPTALSVEDEAKAKEAEVQAARAAARKAKAASSGGSGGSGGGAPAAAEEEEGEEEKKEEAPPPPPKPFLKPKGRPMGEYFRVLGLGEGERAAEKIDHAAVRDTQLLHDAAGLLLSLLTGKEPKHLPPWRPGSTPLVPPTRKAEAAEFTPDEIKAHHRLKKPSDILSDEGVEVSHHLAAILDACADPLAPPTLRQVLSHPYFAPVKGFERDDLRAAYRRWRSGAEKVEDGPNIS